MGWSGGCREPENQKEPVHLGIDGHGLKKSLSFIRLKHGYTEWNFAFLYITETVQLSPRGFEGFGFCR